MGKKCPVRPAASLTGTGGKYNNSHKISNICSIREQDGQASGGNDFGSDDWIFTIREKDPKKLQNGEGQSGTEQVRL